MAHESAAVHMMGVRIGFLGAGNMAESLVQGLCNHGLLDKGQIVLADPSKERKRHFKAAYDMTVFASNTAVVEQAKMIVLAVKPQHMRAMLRDLRGEFTAEHLVISIAAGIPLELIRGMIGEGPRLIRAMPNTPVLAGCGTVGLYASPGVPEADYELAAWMFSSSSVIIRVSRESDLDTITAVSGSGPAYVFYFLESFTKAAEAIGLDPDSAVLACQHTMLGAVKLLMKTGVPASELRKRVTSPGGTTQAALRSLQEDHFQDILQRALDAAKKRSMELAREA